MYGYGSQNTINLFVTFCMADVLVFTAMPIFYEAVIEATYPVAEGIYIYIYIYTHIYDTPIVTTQFLSQICE